MLLAREFGWTPDKMRQLYPSELQAIERELTRQKLIDEYKEQINHWAFLAAVITNDLGAIAGMFSKRKPKTVEADAFISKEWKKRVEGLFKEAHPENRWASYIAETKEKGLKGPW